MMTFTDQGQAISDVDIALVEKELGVVLPLPLREFYKTVNGGVPDCFIFRNEIIFTSISEFPPLISTSDNTSVHYYKVLALETKVIDTRFFPIAVESGGDFFCVDLLTPKASVYLYRQDTTEPAVIDLSLGLVEFMSSLKRDS